MPSDRSPCLAIIPAKGNSRRLPHKNFAMCAGKTLVARAELSAIAAGCFQTIVVSTDLPEARNELHVSSELFLRSNVLCQDGVTTAMVCLDVLSRVNYAFPSFCLLIPTSPLRTPETLRKMWARFCESGAPELRSAIGLLQGHHEGTAIFCDTLEFIKRRDFYHPESELFFVPDAEVCDVNTAEDLARAEAMLAAREARKS